MQWEYLSTIGLQLFDTTMVPWSISYMKVNDWNNVEIKVVIENPFWSESV